jgi:predicted nucleic-acid-binding protein
VKVTVDTNVLIRAVVRDDEKQAKAATTLLKSAELVAVPLPCLCEFVWVLRRVYKLKRPDIQAALEALLDAGNVVVDRSAAEAGLAVFKAGGDLADGLIAHEGRWLGADTFVSFDASAVNLLARQGQDAKLLR